MKDLNNIFKSLNDLKDKRDSKKTNLKSEKVSLNRYDDIESLMSTAEQQGSEGHLYLEKIRESSNIAHAMYTNAIDFHNEALGLAETTRDEFLDLMGEVPKKLSDLISDINNYIDEYKGLLDVALDSYPKV